MVSGSAAASSMRRNRHRLESRGHGGSKRSNRNSIPEYDSEYGVDRPTLRTKQMERSFRALEDNRRQRRQQAKIIFDEYCLAGNKERMKVDQLKPYMARVLHTRKSDLEQEAVDLVLNEAKQKSKEGGDGLKEEKEDNTNDILTKTGVVSAVVKYGEYVRHCKSIQKLFRESDRSNDGKLQRHELRKLIEDYEATKERRTEMCKNVMLFVTEQDLNFILQSADENHDGDIDPTEVVRAIAAWEELAAVKLEDFDQLKCCKGGCVIS